MQVVVESNIVGQTWVPIRILDRPIMIGDIVILKSIAKTLNDNAEYVNHSGYKSRCHIYNNDNVVTRYNFTGEYEAWAIGQRGEDIIKHCVPIELIWDKKNW